MWFRGTYNCIPSKHLQKYLDEFIFSFNRRWNLENIFDKLLVRCVGTSTFTYAELTEYFNSYNIKYLQMQYIKSNYKILKKLHFIKWRVNNDFLPPAKTQNSDKISLP